MEKAATEEEFRDLFLTELDPDWRCKRDWLNQKRDLSDDTDEETRSNAVKSIAKYVVAMDFAENVLNLNGITIGEPIGGRLDDPLVNIPVNPQDCDPDEGNSEDEGQYHKVEGLAKPLSPISQFPPLVPECDLIQVEPVWVKRNEVFLQVYQ